MGQIQGSFNMNLVFDVLTGGPIKTHFPVKAGKHSIGHKSIYSKSRVKKETWCLN